MVKDILIAPHDILATKAKSVKKVDEKVKQVIEDLKDTLIDQKDPIGVGLSGNQIGVLLRMCVIRPEEKGPITVMINPKITKTVEGDENREPTLEGCLSIPNVWGHVLRPEKITVQFMNENGESKTQNFDGFASIVVQHEIDHLDGILFTQRCLTQGYQLYKEVEGELEPYAL